MKLALKIVAGIVACLVLALMVLSVTGLEPQGDRPGLWINGLADAAPVNDWAYIDQIREIKVQTNTWYGLPHSVTTWCVAQDGQLYLATSGATTRSWPRNVARDPHVRLKIGDRVFDRVLQVVTDPAEKEAVLRTRAKKYSQPYPPPAGVSFTVYHAVTQ